MRCALLLEHIGKWVSWKRLENLRLVNALSPSIGCGVKSMMIQDLNGSFVFSEQAPKDCWSNHTCVGQIRCFAGHKSHVLVVTSHSLLLGSSRISAS